MKRNKMKQIVVGVLLSSLVIVAFQNCSNVKFSDAPLSSLNDHAIIDTGNNNGGQVVVTPPVDVPVTVTPPVVTPPVVTPPVTVTPVTPVIPVVPVQKISCSVSASPAAKPTGFVYNAAHNRCMPASGFGPTYRFTLICDADVPRDIAGVRIQYVSQYFSNITNESAHIRNAASDYVGFSYYVPSKAYAEIPAAARSLYYNLTNIQYIGNRSLAVQADYFFANGYRVDQTTKDCGNLRSFDLSIYIYNNDVSFFNTSPAQITLQ